MFLFSRDRVQSAVAEVDCMRDKSYSISMVALCPLESLLKRAFCVPEKALGPE